MEREQYLSVLRRLPLDRPTRADFEQLLPHLSPGQLRGVCGRASGTAVTVALPSVRVRGAYFELYYSSRGRGSFVILNAHSARNPASYTRWKPAPSKYWPPETPFAEEAMAYAERHWGGYLLVDDWVDVGTVYLDDPTDLDGRGHPHTKHVAYWTTSRPWKEIYDDLSRPTYESWDQALTHITLDPLEGMEFEGQRTNWLLWNCAYCGYGLSFDHCDLCGGSFARNEWMMAWKVPLPDAIEQELRRAGHSFGMDPHFARSYFRRTVFAPLREREERNL